MNEDPRNEAPGEAPYIGDEFADSTSGATIDETSMTEGVGGLPEVEDKTRATVSDVDGDNVEPDPERKPQV
ncbi:MAG TPA: hypothetical protein VMZ33_02655 [Candidatus Limnocylindrales bacterium]|nr:hypothetical protein [Candidatus Limnocylindrales bacterium]